MKRIRITIEVDTKWSRTAFDDFIKRRLIDTIDSFYPNEMVYLATEEVQKDRVDRHMLKGSPS